MWTKNTQEFFVLFSCNSSVGSNGLKIRSFKNNSSFLNYFAKKLKTSNISCFKIKEVKEETLKPGSICLSIYRPAQVSPFPSE